MNLTEAEAKTRWCPFARQIVTIKNDIGPIQLSSANRFEGDAVSLCIGSGCMAWRRDLDIETKQQTPKPEGDGWYRDQMSRPPEIWWRRTVIAGGHCGLAGKP